MTRYSAIGRWLLFALFATRGTAAQVPSKRQSATAPAPALFGNTLKTRLGIRVAETLLKDQDPEQRQRGFERLGNVGTAQALDLLLKVFETGGSARTAKDRLVAVRALAPHAAVPAVREFLVRIMVGVGSNPGHSAAIDGLIERAAALSLAAAGDDAALAALGKALRQSGHVADTASDALLAFPPRNLQPIVQDLRAPTRTLASLLGELGDPRVIPALREIVRSAPIEVRAEAALALARLGVSETVDLARHWLRQEYGKELRIAATRILLEFHTADAGAAVARLLADPQSRADGVSLASLTHSPELASTLIAGAKNAEPDQQSAWFSAIERTGAHEAFVFLGRALNEPETSSAAALALALSPAPEAERVLEQALRAASSRRAAARAAIVRRVALDRTPAGFNAALSELGRSQNPSDRAVYLQGSALASSSRVPEFLKRASSSEVRALARTAQLPDVARALAERLASEPEPALREVLAACLVSPEAAERVPSDVLIALLDAQGLAAPLAARALAARDSRILRPKIVALLASDDVLLRSHTALGLGQSKDSSALGVLEGAYRFETDAHVRLAIVHALSARREPARLRALALARTLDASAPVREAALLALAGAEPERNTAGPQTAWLEFKLESGADPEAGTFSAAVLTESGLALPAASDPDGVLLLPALPTGSFELRLAAPARNDNAQLPRQP